MNGLENHFRDALAQRNEKGLLRALQVPNPDLVDFASNDYLGFARQDEVMLEDRGGELSDNEIGKGSTGSRLLTGNTSSAEALEARIAEFHQAESALLFNSGYDANLGLFSAFKSENVRIVYDALSHASIIDGVRLSKATSFRFPHNDLEVLEQRLQAPFNGPTLVVVESVYSMDGDFAPLEDLVKLCQRYSAQLFVDEAHATGLYGPKGEGRVVELGLADAVDIRLHTFGKALGCHGAAMLGSSNMRSWLVNFARSFIYSTALPDHSLLAIDNAYDRLSADFDCDLKISNLIRLFQQKVDVLNLLQFSSNFSPIQTVLVPGNAAAKQLSENLKLAGFDVRPILSPTVAKGTERLRICLHAFNNEQQVTDLIETIKTHL